MNKYMRVKQIAATVGVSQSTIWRWVQAGTLPKPLHLTPRTSVWRSTDVEDAIEKMAENGEGDL